MKTLLVGIFAVWIAGSVGAQAPQRIVTAGGTVTEIVFALGQGSRIIGTDISSLFPLEATQKAHVGYVRQLSAEGLLSLGPDVLLTTQDAGPPTALAQIRAAGVKVVVVPGGSSWQAARDRITFLADLLGVKAAAQPLLDSLSAAEQRSLIHKPLRGPKVLFVYARGAGTLMVSGTGTEADAIITLAGGVNAVPGYEGYRPLTPEAVGASAPDVLLFTSMGLKSLGGVAGLQQLPALTAGGTLAHAKVVDVDDLTLLGFGPRMGLAIDALQSAFR